MRLKVLIEETLTFFYQDLRQKIYSNLLFRTGRATLFVSTALPLRFLVTAITSAALRINIFKQLRRKRCSIYE
jgi:hypothetical protein